MTNENHLFFYEIKEEVLNHIFLFSDTNKVNVGDKVASVFIEGINKGGGLYIKQIIERDLEKFLNKYEFTGEIKGKIPCYRRKI